MGPLRVECVPCCVLNLTRVNVAIQTHITGDIAARSFVEKLDANHRTIIAELLGPLQQEITTLRSRVGVLEPPS